MKYFTILLPTKAYLCRYIETIYGQPGSRHLVLDPASDFGDIIISKLACTLHSDLKPAEQQMKLFRMNATLVLKVPLHFLRKLPNKNLTAHQVIRINRHLENMFERDLCDIVSRAHDTMNIGRQVAIESFAANHSIELETDITFEALKKVEYRYRSKYARHSVRKKIVQDLAPKILN